MNYIILFSSLTLFNLTFLQARLLNKTIATINHKMIFLSQINSTKKELKNSNLPDSLRDLLYKNKNLLKNNKILLDYLITKQLIFNKIKKHGLSVPASKVNSYVDKIRENYQLTHSQFSQLLKEKNINYSNYKKNIQSKLEINQFLRQFISPQVKISSTTVKNYIKRTNKKIPALDKHYELVHVVSKKRSANLFAKPFQPWLTINYSEMSKKIKALVTRIGKKKKPQFIKIANKYHLVKIKKITKVQSAAYAELFNSTKARLFDIQFKSLLQKWVKKEKKTAQIKIFL